MIWLLFPKKNSIDYSIDLKCIFELNVNSETLESLPE